MKKLILAIALIFLASSIFAADTTPGKNRKSSKKSTTANTLACKVIEMKGVNNQVSYVAVFFETGTVSDNIIVFADNKVVEEYKNTANVEIFSSELKRKYNGIKIINKTKFN